jgi:hypothetical protein
LKEIAATSKEISDKFRSLCNQNLLRAFLAPFAPNPNSTDLETYGKCEWRKQDLPNRPFQFVLAQTTFFSKFLLKIRPIHKKQISQQR